MPPSLTFDDLLALDVTCQMISGTTGCCLVIGAVEQPVTVRLRFGLPVLTLPYPILVNSLMTERNTRLSQLSLFGWIEDNAILEPRAEVFGLTPLRDDPVLFLRDLDLDRPPEAYAQAPQPVGWLKVVAVLLAQQGTVEPQLISGDTAALRALQIVLPVSAQALLTTLRNEVQSGKDLRHVLRAQRRNADPALMAICDGWRVLSRAVQIAVCDASADSIETNVRGLPLDLPRKWIV
jgi:hypothetical protein